MNILNLYYFILFIFQINAFLQHNASESTKLLQRNKRYAQKSFGFSNILSKLSTQKPIITIKPAIMMAAVTTKPTLVNTPVPIKSFSSKLLNLYTKSDQSTTIAKEIKSSDNNTANNLNSSITANTTKIRPVGPYSPLVKSYLESVKNKDYCDTANCDMLPPTDFKFGGLTDGMTQQGLFVHKCGKKNKTFLLTKATYVSMALWKTCCLQGMTPATIETRDEINCIYDAYQKNLDQEISVNHLFLINYADLKGKRDIRSCPDKLPIPDELWMDNQPDNARGMQTTVALNLKGSKEAVGFDDVNGLEKMNILCQIVVKQKKIKKVIPYTKAVVTLYKTMGPQNFSCSARLKECNRLFPNKPYRFAGQETVLQPDGILITKCSPNRHYFLSTSMAPYLPNYLYCCSMGMLPGIIETREEMDCVNAYYKNYTSKFGSRKKSFMLGYYDEQLNHEFKSCPDQFDLPPDELFAFGEPSNNLGAQNCISVYVGASRVDSGIDDITCLEKISPLCERILPPNEKLMKPYSNTTLKVINSLTSNGKKDICEQNKCKVSKVFESSTALKDNGTKGIFHFGCNEKVFFLSFTTTVGTKLWETCCSFGMVPAEFESRDEMSCIYNSYRNYGAHPKFNGQKSFLVSYIDSTMNYTYTACPNKQQAPANLWAPGQPDNAKGTEVCVLVAFDNTRKNVGFHDAPCEQALFLPLCQVHDENAGATTAAVEEEETSTTRKITKTTLPITRKTSSRFNDYDDEQ